MFVAFAFLPAFFNVGFFVGTPSPYTLDRADEISTYVWILAHERSEVHKYPLRNFPESNFPIRTGVVELLKKGSEKIS